MIRVGGKRRYFIVYPVLAQVLATEMAAHGIASD
jgi:hypothetical protein